MKSKHPEIFGNHSIKLIALLLVLVFSYSFMHSELDFISSEAENHVEHDYCQLVEAAAVKDVGSSSSIFKIKFESIVLTDSVTEVLTNGNYTGYVHEPFPLTIKKNKSFYLLNQIFLI